MKPEGARVWRKTLRREARGTTRGRRPTHPVEQQPPRKGSTWLRRHRWMPDAWTIWMETSR